MAAFIIGLIFLGVGGFFIFQGYNIKKKKNLVEKTETTKINLLKEGICEVKGKVVKKDLLKSPLFEKDCVFYKYYVEEQHKDKKGHKRWKIIREGIKYNNFFLEDTSGKVEINPEKAEFDALQSNSIIIGSGKDFPNHIKKFLEDNNIKYKDLFGSIKTMKLTENIIQEKETLYVLGNCEKTNKDESDYQINNKSGILLISTREEKDFVKTLRNKMLANLIGGFIFAVLGLILFVVLLKG
ncbi:MAG: GIDE domain-containing protein [Candidatus Woesearchaeota archaeon]